MRRTRHLLPGLTLLLLLPGAAGAQIVHGTVTDADDGRPLEVAFVVLVDDQGRQHASILTDADGGFRLRAPAPGAYRVRVERIGYDDVESATLEVPERGAVRVSLGATARAVALEGIDVEGEARCTVRPGEGELTARLWDEARKALAVTTWAQGPRVLRFRTVEWRRKLDPETLRVEEETRTPRAGFHAGSPFVSPPAGELQENGYIRELEGGDLEYYAPDPSVLLSDAFLDAHCFLVRLDDPPQEGWVGLAFRPVRRGDVPDIEGVFWLDAATSELRRVEYRYTHLPADLRSDRVGGALELDRIPQGPWIVKRWAIRTPVIGLRARRNPRGERRPSEPYLAGLNETGGEVVAIRTPEGSPLLRAARATVTGTVFDSVASAPLAGATVRLAGTGFAAVTDEGGSFRMDGLPDGSYTVTFEHGRLGELGWVPEGLPVDLAPGDTVAIALALPPADRILERGCQVTADDRGTAVLVGRVGPPGPGAEAPEVVLAWEAARVRDRGARLGDAVQVERVGRSLSVSAEGDGAFRVCGLPEGEEITVRAGRDGEATGDAVRVTLGRGEIRRLDLELADRIPRALDVEGVTVTVDAVPLAERSLRMVGIDPASLGRRWITRADIEAIAVRRDVGTILEWRGINGMRVIRPENLMRGENMGLCIALVRARTAKGLGRCALIVVDGRRKDPVQGLYLDPESIAAIAVLQPMEATVVFGVAGEAGAVMFWTRQGGR